MNHYSVCSFIRPNLLSSITTYQLFIPCLIYHKFRKITLNSAQLAGSQAIMMILNMTLLASSNAPQIAGVDQNSGGGGYLVGGRLYTEASELYPILL